jgi:hypothetical protein
MMIDAEYLPQLAEALQDAPRTHALLKQLVEMAE